MLGVCIFDADKFSVNCAILFIICNQMVKMKKIIPALLLLLFFNKLSAQNFSQILLNVDTVHLPGINPTHLGLLDTNAVPIISSNPCDNQMFNFIVGSTHQSGRVLAVGHEGLLTNNNIGSFDNLTLVENMFDWLNPGTKRVSVKEGWVNLSNTSTVQTALTSSGYSFTKITGTITTASLANTDILVLGNDWNAMQSYSTAVLSDIETFVSNGGSLLIIGIGWSWPQSLSDYPMNQVANVFGIDYTTHTIWDPYNNINSAPLFFNFYPENITSSASNCPSMYVGKNVARGDALTVLKLAVSLTGEFTQQNGGVAASKVLLNNWLNEINEIYGREYSVIFELIPNNDALIFSNAVNDPWPTLPPGSGACTNAGLILGIQGNVIDSIIGSANYDISHVIVGSPYGGGCAGSLTAGMSGGFHMGVTRHEMGHQFGQHHIIDNGSNINYEPKKTGGWTIQGGNDHPYAHAQSYHELAEFLQTHPGLGQQVATNNTIPTIDAGADVYIPISTPFELTATAFDPDPSDSLTFVWDNMSRGPQQSIPVPDDSRGALFWRLLPDTTPTRVFPKIDDVIANNNSNGQEQLPTQARVMNFRITVNDNHKTVYNNQTISASGINSIDKKVTVAAAGPFEVTSQGGPGVIYTGGTDQSIIWNVNGTDSLPINTQLVTISLSLDGGYTYPIILTDSAVNNGSALVSLPNIDADSVRVKVAANNSVYFDINTHNFSIQKALISSKDNMFKHVKIYPNPAQDLLTISFMHPNFEVKLYNTRMQLVSEYEGNGVMNVADLSGGVYLLELLDVHGSQREFRKLVIQR